MPSLSILTAVLENSSHRAVAKYKTVQDRVLAGKGSGILVKIKFIFILVAVLTVKLLMASVAALTLNFAAFENIAEVKEIARKIKQSRY